MILKHPDDKTPQIQALETLLSTAPESVKPKIHVCGHIHSGYGYQFVDGTHYFNAAVLGEDYRYQNKPISFVWDRDTNGVEFI
jgi:hypothetical protein